MASVLILELNNLLTEYVRDNPITGKPMLDQRLVTFAIGIITTYLMYTINEILKPFWNYIYGKYIKKSETYFIESKHIEKVFIKCPGTLYSAITQFIPKLPPANYFTNDNGNDQDCLVVQSDTIDPKKPWKSIYIDYASFNLHFIGSSHSNEKVNHKVLYKKKPMLIVRKYNGNDGNNYYYFFIEKEPEETKKDIQNIVDSFLKEAMDTYTQKNVKEKFAPVQVVEIVNGEWRTVQKLEPKDYSTIVGDNCKRIINDIDKFFSVYGELYKTLGIVHKRNYLLYGPPGTGKTSIIKSIASYKKRSIYKISFKEDRLGDDEYKQLIKQIPVESIVLMDDVTSELLEDEGKLVKKYTETVFAREGDINGENKQLTVEKVVSYDTLLNILDGVNSSSGRITFITTNHPEKMGKAIRRPGRIDVKVKLGYASDQEIKDYFALFYKFFDMDPKVIQENADKFIEKIHTHDKGDKLTFAELQQFLVQYMEDISKVVENWNMVFDDQEISACM